ncbi:MAG: hypothetical protein CMF38_07260 [Legionellaceae bacterium]|nr:hypothetical protein [Legionellaceae bacterium]HCA89724.1 hypothetical protein [Legionellales bacterium]|tara:strand:+ start:244 stop:1476 length:1233 start_codon:yes stop_codon:yes gene_type:complete
MSNILVVSLDFDGCLFNSKYFEKIKDVSNSQFKDNVQYEAISDTNKDFLEMLRNKSNGYRNFYTLIGSNRQSIYLDYYNSINQLTSGSCFRVIQSISDYIGATFDPMLLADLANHQAIGRNISIAQVFFEKDRPVYQNSPRINLEIHPAKIDEYKILLIYAQVHRMASMHPDDTITFEFYDDRDKDILKNLHEFYKKYSHLIPTNVTLNLNQYDGEKESSLKYSLTGTGAIDTDYAETYRNMAENSKETSQSGYDRYHPQRLLSGLNQLSFVEDCIKTFEEKLDVKLKENTSSCNFLMHDLRRRLEQEVNRYIQLPNKDKMNLSTAERFQKNCVSHIQKIEKQLDTQNSWKPFLKNMALMLFVISAPCAVYSLGTRAFQGHYAFFHKPTSDATLLEIKQNIAKPIANQTV